VVKASLIANQVMKACLGIEKGNQINAHQSTTFSLTQMESQVYEQENVPVFKVFHFGLSSSPIGTVYNLLFKYMKNAVRLFEEVKGFPTRETQ
jgi:hypothetical protein